MLARLASRRRADLTRARAPAPSPPAPGVSMPPRAAPARAPVRPRPRREPAPPRAVADDEALLAELGGSDAEEPDAGEPDAEESMEALERRLRGELATMADGMAEDEAALRRDLDAMGDEEDEADVLMREILAEERAERDAVAASVAASIAADAEALRAECHAMKLEAVRLKRAGDMDGAREALRRAKALAARAEAAEAEAARAADRGESPGAAGAPLGASLGASSLGASLAALEEAVKAAKLDAIAKKRSGDMAGARASLRRSKELQATLDRRREEATQEESGRPRDLSVEASSNTPEKNTREPGAAANAGSRSNHRTESSRNASSATRADLQPPPEDLDAMLAAARSAAAGDSAGESEGEGEATLAAASGNDDDDANEDAELLRRELGGDALGETHFGDAYDGLDASGAARDVDEGALARARAAELDAEAKEAKARAVRLRREGDAEGAREALREAKRTQAELERVKADFGVE